MLNAWAERSWEDAMPVGGAFAPDSSGAASDRFGGLSWPLSRLGEGVEELCRRAGLRPDAGEATALPNSVADDPAELSRWMSWLAERFGVEAEPLESTPARLDELLRGAGPALLQFEEAGRTRFFLLLGTRFGKPQLVGPDLAVHSCPLEFLHEALCAAHEAPMNADIDRLLAAAQVPARRRQRVRSIIARERLATKRIGGFWLFRLPPSAGFSRQLKQARVGPKLAVMMGLFGLVYGLEILGWGVIGDAALNGRLDLGWLAAWVLLMISVIPMRLLGGWFDASLAIDLSRLIKTRLLCGALRQDLEAVKERGVGQLLGRVMDAQAFEALALNGGLTALVAIVELGLSGWVLSLGSGGLLHVALLCLWLFAAVGLSLGYFRRLRDWTLTRIGMTHELIEGMVGHRTMLAQEIVERRHDHEDHMVKDYVTCSTEMDRSITRFVAGVPSGWMLIGMIGLAPAFVSGTASAAGLAIGLGGVLLAARAFSGIASSLGAAAQAVIAWKQVKPLFDAAGPARPVPAFIPIEQMQPDEAARNSTFLVEAESLTYRYPRQGEAVLRDASLAIRHGERLLIEGPSGGGKSTLASLLVGLREPNSGLLLFNGLDRHTLGEGWLQFATEAPQFHENHILSGTLAFNLLMGRSWPASDAALDEARDLCLELGLGELLERMPSGIMQTVGETGWQLSHGERSRIFLARALLQDAPLIVLDESFAALDPENLEACLACAFRRAGTLIVIAHP
jgi:ATP-binding cassette, subfamily B, bacterial